MGQIYKTWTQKFILMVHLSRVRCVTCNLLIFIDIAYIHLNPIVERHPLKRL